MAATFTLSNLAEGAHSVNVRARDAAGNIDATPVAFSWTVDSQPPETTIGSSPAANSNSATASFTFASEVNATFEASVDGGAYAAASSPRQLSGLTSGAHTFNVRAIDAAGNVDATPASFSWQVDTSQPSAQIVFPTPVSYTEATQLHVRGTASDAHTITSVTVNGVAANSTDAFAHWSALVPIATGDNNLVVSVTDNFGNTNSNAASAQVANRGIVLSGLHGMAWDGAQDRVLTADDGRAAIIALRASDGHATILSDATHGSGPAGNFNLLAVDATNNRAIALGGGEVLSVNLTNGNRTVIPTAAFDVDTTFFAGTTCNSPCTTLYSTSIGGPEVAVFSVNLANGARTVISGGAFHQGSGPSLISPNAMVLDTSQPAPRLLVTDTYLDAVVAVDLATGNRSVFSSALPASSPVGSGPAIDTPQGIVLDAANNRALIGNYQAGQPNQLLAVNLANGNRTLLAVTGTSTSYQVSTALTLNPANARLYTAMYPRANVVQTDLATLQQSRFADSNVGTGPVLAGGSVLLDTSTGSRSLITNALGAVVRVDLATGARSAIIATQHANGGPPYTPQYLQYDTRPGVPANRLFFTGEVSSTTRLFSGDLGTGVITLLSTAVIPYQPHPELPLDAANGRLLIDEIVTASQSRVMPIDVLTGTKGPAVADAASGTPSFGWLNAMALENAPGQPQRLIAMDAQGILYGIDTTTGTRTVVSSNASVGTGPSLAYADSFAINPATRRALAASSYSNSVIEIDLLTGNRSFISGHNLDDDSMRGSGPGIYGIWSRIAADFPEQLAFVTSNAEFILAVDLVSGDRVITAR